MSDQMQALPHIFPHPSPKRRP